MSLLNNAIDSIALGVEDFKNTDTRRLLSATRNLFAGILLLFKHRLSELSPPGSGEILIKRDARPVKDPQTGAVVWHGCGKKTVDVQQIKERFDSLCIKVDWNRIDKINKHRNDIEHYHSGASQDAVRSLLADCFVVIRDFVRSELNADPMTLLGSDTWQALTGVAEVYEREKKECVDRIQLIDWQYDSLLNAIIEYSCSKCGSGLIDVTTTTDRESAEFRCRSCGTTWSFEEIAGLAVSDFFASENHLSIKDGGEEVTVMCPNCCTDTYVLEDDACVVCGESMERECQRCGMNIPACELDGSGFCSWCNHMMSKDD